MKSIFLSVVIICALAVAGVGGTLAGFSDSEISQDNVITTGSIDLKVNGQDDPPWGAGVPVKVNIDHMTPSKWYHFDIEVRNDGQCEIDPDLYIHFKDFRCVNVNPLHDGYDDPFGPFPLPDSYTPLGDEGNLKPEPELVAEYGGLVGQRYVDGVGRHGDNCTLSTAIDVIVSYDGGEVWHGKMVDLNSVQLYLGKLEMSGVTHWVNLAFHLQQEEDLINYWPDKHNPDDMGPVLDKFLYWPTNALMKDRIMFDIEFDLLQIDP